MEKGKLMLIIKLIHLNQWQEASIDKLFVKSYLWIIDKWIIDKL